MSRIGWPIRTNDGRFVLVRSLDAGRRTAFRQFIRDLSPQARSSRFLAAVNDLSESMLDALTSTHGASTVAWIADDAAKPGRIIAEARYVATDQREAELAVAVTDRWQHRGLGTRLVYQLVEHARTRGLKRAWSYVRRDNEAMLAIAWRLGFRAKPSVDDPSLVLIDRVLPRLERTVESEG